MKEKITKLKNILIKNKPIVFLFAIIMLTIVGSTFAYYYSKYIQENNFNVADYSISLEEYFPVTTWDDDNTLDKEVKIVNTGNADVLLRVSYNEMWYSGDDIVNNLYNGTPIVNKIWSEAFINDFKYSDGWYYYNKVLQKGDNVVILESIEKVADVYNESNNKYNLDFNYEVLQAKSGAAVKVWGKEAIIEGNGVEWKL